VGKEKSVNLFVMAKLIDLSAKVRIIHCAEEYGVERAASYYNAPIHLVTKWLKGKESIFQKQKIRADSQRAYIRKRYREGTLIVKQYKKETRKSPFVALTKSLKRNLRKKGRSYEMCPEAIDLWKLALNQRLKCKYSGLKLTKKNISIDHILPLSKGGDSDISNLCLVTKEVNYMKHTMGAEEFIDLCKIIVDYNKNK
jgi:hypothetical protein